MPTSILDAGLAGVLSGFQTAALGMQTKLVTVDGNPISVQTPFPSPTDWRDIWIYFLMLDRFNNPAAPPNSLPYDLKYGYRQGGTFNGVRSQLGYIRDLGANALWITPVLKNARPDQPPDHEYNYHGYGAQDFLTVDDRFASDGTVATAEKELAALVDEAHARGIYVIVDIVLNHTADVFEYVLNGNLVDSFQDPNVMNAPLGQEPLIRWIDGVGVAEPAWQPDLPVSKLLGPDDAVWPSDLQRKEFFRRRGATLTNDPGTSFVRGDFGDMRQLVGEYDATAPNQAAIRALYGASPVLQILVRSYSYLLAKFDIDAFRIDSVKYVNPQTVANFGNAIREYALTCGKKNFFMFGEIYDQESVVDRFVGRSSGQNEGLGIDAALDFPMFFNLPGVAKANIGVETIYQVINNRKAAEEGQISSHGEAGEYFVTFLDNHDQDERFHHPLTPDAQVKLGLAILFGLQGIPCVYYGTEQGLTGTKDANGNPVLDSPESVREALWGKPNAFDQANSFYTDIQALSALRLRVPALRFGRIYPREVSGNNQDYGLSSGAGGIVAFSRIVSDQEVVVIANTNPTVAFQGSVVVDLDLHQNPQPLTIAYSNFGTAGTTPVTVAQRNLNGPSTVAAATVNLQPMEAQILIP